MRRVHALALGLLCGAASAGTSGLDQVMGLLAARRHGRSDYIEQRFTSLVRRPLESRGVLSFDAPDRLEKRTVEPRAETLIVAGDQLTLERGHRRRVLQLGDVPQLLPVLDAVRATLAGDRAGLERIFAVRFGGDTARWTLELEPSDPALARAVARIDVDGAGADLLHVEIRYADGDRSRMTLRNSTVPP
jgi:hypothetical protein